LTLNPNRRLLGADIAFKPGPRPPGHPRIIWVPIFAIQKRTDNRAATLDAAKAELEASRKQWKAWAGLEEIT